MLAVRGGAVPVISLQAGHGALQVALFTAAAAAHTLQLVLVGWRCQVKGKWLHDDLSRSREARSAHQTRLDAVRASTLLAAVCARRLEPVLPNPPPEPST